MGSREAWRHGPNECHASPKATHPSTSRTPSDPISRPVLGVTNAGSAAASEGTTLGQSVRQASFGNAAPILCSTKRDSSKETNSALQDPNPPGHIYPLGVSSLTNEEE